MTHLSSTLKKNLFGYTLQKLQTNLHFSAENEIVANVYESLKQSRQIKKGASSSISSIGKSTSNTFSEHLNATLAQSNEQISFKLQDAQSLQETLGSESMESASFSPIHTLNKGTESHNNHKIRLDQLKSVNIVKHDPKVPEKKRNSKNAKSYFELILPDFRIKQIKNNLYKNYRNDPNKIQQVSQIGDWTDIPLTLRTLLESEYTVNWGEVTNESVAKDFTVKFLSKLADGERIESVIIPASIKRTNNPHSSSKPKKNHHSQKREDEMHDFDSDYAPLPTTFIQNNSFTVSKASTSTIHALESSYHKPHSKDNQTQLLPATLCVSSQVGCSMQCSFCFTGTQKMKRNLTSGEIVGQYMNAQQIMTPKSFTISNIVFMGQGEFGYNYRNVKDAIEIFTDELGISGKKIIVSTCGVVPAMKKLTKEIKVNLAVSLHATNDTLRDKIVPVNRMFPLKELMEACRDYEQNSGKRLSFEYVMLDGVNDSFEDAKSLVQLLRGLSCSVNLIPFNPWPGTPYKSSPNERIVKFSQYLYYHKIPAPIRWSRGDDILAACGQLRSDEELKPNLLETHPLYQKLDCTKTKQDAL